MATELDSHLTPASRLAADRMEIAIERAITGHPLYPSGTAFVGSDLPNLGDILARHVRERTPVVVVYPDGEERLVGPWASERTHRGPRELLDRLRGRWPAA